MPPQAGAGALSCVVIFDGMWSVKLTPVRSIDGFGFEMEMCSTVVPPTTISVASACLLPTCTSTAVKVNDVLALPPWPSLTCTVISVLPLLAGLPESDHETLDKEVTDKCAASFGTT